MSLVIIWLSVVILFCETTYSYFRCSLMLGIITAIQNTWLIVSTLGQTFLWEQIIQIHTYVLIILFWKPLSFLYLQSAKACLNVDGKSWENCSKKIVQMSLFGLWKDHSVLIIKAHKSNPTVSHSDYKTDISH